MGVRVRFVGAGDAFGSGGRFQTCILVDAPGRRFLVDCGASSPVALRQQGIDPLSIDAILLTHLHGDHCGGVPFLMLDWMFVSQRARPLVLAGPPGFQPRMAALADALFPGTSAFTPRFPVSWVELPTGARTEVLDLAVTAWPAVHPAEARPAMLRVECGGRTIAYTGDTEWTEDLVALAHGADLFVTECSAFERRAPTHLSYAELRPNLPRLEARRIVLTHLGPEMLSNLARVDVPCAQDGLVIDL